MTRISLNRNGGGFLDKHLISVPRQVENNYEGFHFLSKSYQSIKGIKKCKVTYDFSKTVWFEANLVSVLSTLFEAHRFNDCHVELRNVSEKIRKIFKKNGFYDYYNLGQEFDEFGSTITFKKFDCNDEEGFTHYLDEEVIPKIQLPLSDIQVRKFKNCLQEVFVNVGLHAHSNHVFTCGQYYPEKKKVAFTITDIGKTIAYNVRKKMPEKEIVDCDAIDWATQFGNTTKIDGDGGIGLALIREYLCGNGKFQIISGNGYWESEEGEVYSRKMNTYFEGTIINIVSDLKKNIDIPKQTILF